MVLVHPTWYVVLIRLLFLALLNHVYSVHERVGNTAGDAPTPVGGIQLGRGQNSPDVLPIPTDASQVTMVVRNSVQGVRPPGVLLSNLPYLDTVHRINR